MPNLCTVAEVKTYLGITDTSSDALITSLIPAVSADLLGELNRLDLTPDDDYDDFICGNGEQKLFLKHYPINSVTSVTINDEDIDEWDELLTSQGWRLTEDPNVENMQFIELIGRSTGSPAKWWGWPFSIIPNVKISYNAGYATVPPAIKQAAIEWIAFRRGASQLQQLNQTGGSRTIGTYSETGSTIDMTLAALTADIPENVQRVIDQYKRNVI